MLAHLIHFLLLSTVEIFGYEHEYDNFTSTGHVENDEVETMKEYFSKAR